MDRHHVCVMGCLLIVMVLLITCDAKATPCSETQKIICHKSQGCDFNGTCINFLSPPVDEYGFICLCGKKPLPEKEELKSKEAETKAAESTIAAAAEVKKEEDKTGPNAA